MGLDCGGVVGGSAVETIGSAVETIEGLLDLEIVDSGAVFFETEVEIVERLSKGVELLAEVGRGGWCLQGRSRRRMGCELFESGDA